jgi:hypothetical protein
MGVVCRVCGLECEPGELRAAADGGGCINCNGSPACTRCGHPRRQHASTLVGSGCTSTVTLDGGRATGRCGCPGYTRDASALWEPVRVVDDELPWAG